MKRNFKTLLTCVLVTSTLLATGCTAKNTSNTSVNLAPNTVLAKLDNFTLSKEIIDKEIAPSIDFQKKMYTDISDEELKFLTESLTNSTAIYLIQTEALYKEAEKNKFTIDPKLLDEQKKSLEEYISTYFEMTLDEFKEKYGFSTEYVDENLKKQLIVEEYLRTVVNITDESVKDYYEKNKEDFRLVRASHILISNSNEHPEGEHEHTEGENQHANLSKAEQDKLEKTKKANKEKALEVLNKAKAGEDFKTLSDTYSDDPGAKETAGDLDYFGKGEMVIEFENACFDKNFKSGEIYKDIVETDYGYHIIKKTDDKISTFEEVKDYIKEDILYNEQLTKYLEKTFAKYNFEYHETIESAEN